MNAIFNIPAREYIGRAKSVEDDKYDEVYTQIKEDMIAQIDEILAREVV